jgi:hypothetical protein
LLQLVLKGIEYTITFTINGTACGVLFNLLVKGENYMNNDVYIGGLREEDYLDYEELLSIKQCYADAVRDELDLIEG